MNWRPEGWWKMKTKAHNELIEAHGKQHWPTFDDDYMEAGADAMLEAICKEIEKMENPYVVPSTTPEGVLRHFAFEECRQKILDLLKKDQMAKIWELNPRKWAELYRRFKGKDWKPPKKDKRGIECEVKKEGIEEIKGIMKEKPNPTKRK